MPHFGKGSSYAAVHVFVVKKTQNPPIGGQTSCMVMPSTLLSLTCDSSKIRLYKKLSPTLPKWKQVLCFADSTKQHKLASRLSNFRFTRNVKNNPTSEGLVTATTFGQSHFERRRFSHLTVRTFQDNSIRDTRYVRKARTRGRETTVMKRMEEKTNAFTN